MKKFILLILFISASVVAQDKKAEKEESIDKKEMPESAQSYLAENIPKKARKIRYYFEIDGDKKSYEAKFKLNSYRYSVEFSVNGELEDIEVEVDDDELDQSIFQNITRYIDAENDRYKIEKIQLQFLPESADIAAIYRTPLKANYSNLELIVATKNSGKLEKFEMTFDASGNFIKKRKAIRISYDYLIF